jgi:Recombinase zinc beta ribbon domain
LTAGFLGLVSEYVRRSTGERVWSAIAQAVEEGRPPFPRIPPGLRRISDDHPDKALRGTLEVVPELREAIVEAFELRAGGQPWRVIREHLGEHGIEVSPHAVKSMLDSRLYVGELHFGDLVNLHACEAIVSHELHERAKGARAVRGRLGKSDLLLSRQRVLFCHRCQARMSAGNMRQKNGSLCHYYRCQNPPELCDARPTISAKIADEVVLAATERLLGDVHGHASLHGEVDALRLTAEAAQDALSKAVRAFDGLGDEEAAREKLQALRAARDAAQLAYEELRDTVLPLETFRAEDLRGSEVVKQRRAIKVAIARVEVRPGRGSAAERLTVIPRGSKALA